MDRIVGCRGRPQCRATAILTSPRTSLAGSPRRRFSSSGAVTATQSSAASAVRRLRGAHRVTVVDGAGSLFAEPGTLEAAARLAADWFTEHMTAARTAPPHTNPMAAGANERRPSHARPDQGQPKVDQAPRH